MPISQDFEVSAGRKRATEYTTQPAIPLARITTGWACQIAIAALFQTIAVRTKVPDHGELFRGQVRGEKSSGGQKVDFSCFLVAKFPVDTPSCGRTPPDRLLWV